MCNLHLKNPYLESQSRWGNAVAAATLSTAEEAKLKHYYYKHYFYQRAKDAFHRNIDTIKIYKDVQYYRPVAVSDT